MSSTTYVPGTLETDPKKLVMSLQQLGPKLDGNIDDTATNTADITTNTTNIATNTANIATNTANIATNTSNISTLQTKTSGYEAAWTTWAPTVVPGSGSFTTVSAAGAYLAIGKLVHFTVTITITTVGTAGGAMSIALPIGTAKRPAAVIAQETVTTGLVGFGRILTSGTSIVSILRYDNGSYIGAGNVVTLTGIYEQT